MSFGTKFRGNAYILYGYPGRARDFKFWIRPGVGVGVGSEAGVGVGVGTKPPRLRNPAFSRTISAVMYAVPSVSDESDFGSAQSNIGRAQLKYTKYTNRHPLLTGQGYVTVHVMDQVAMSPRFFFSKCSRVKVSREPPRVMVTPTGQGHYGHYNGKGAHSMFSGTTHKHTFSNYLTSS